MALQLKFTETLGNNCKSFVNKETTGAYNNPDNLTGWNAPNAALADVDTATLTIQNLTTNTTYDFINITPSSSNLETTINSIDLKIEGVSIGNVLIPDGQYCFTYTITMDDGTVYSQQVKKVWLCESCCKIKTKACEIDIDCDCCNDDCTEEILKFLQAFSEMKIIEYSAYCGSSDSINKKIKSLQSLLKSFDCKTC